MSAKVYATRVCDDLRLVDAPAWERLLRAQDEPTPFMSLAYLRELQSSGCAAVESGWRPSHLLLERDGRLVGAVPAYAKHHSYGEYVFDWAWADAYRRHGLRYYPKLLAAVPFTPVPGSRLLAEDEEARRALVRALAAQARDRGWSSAHVLFLSAADRAAFEAEGWMIRRGVQFHWTRPPGIPLTRLEDHLATLQRHKRKNILQERRRVRDMGVTFRVREGACISTSEWELFLRCYERTYALHGSTPYLNAAFFAGLAQHMPQHCLMFIASHDGQDFATSLVAIDRERRTAWGRWWGSLLDVPLVHFEACYYQPLAWCIENGFDRFEGGAQGEHKMARGLLPAPTVSAHWIGDARFASAVDDFLARETHAIEQYEDELRERSPFKPGGGPSSSSTSRA